MLNYFEVVHHECIQMLIDDNIYKEELDQEQRITFFSSGEIHVQKLLDEEVSILRVPRILYPLY
jgi:hypothetical protein